MDKCIPGFFIILLIITLTGLLGGIRNWHFDESASKKPMLARVIDGIIAAAAIPLFLSIIGNEKIVATFGKIRIWDADYQQAIFILIGFCSLAAVFSQRFLESLSKRVMQLNEKVDRVEQEVKQSSLVAELQVENDYKSPSSAAGEDNNRAIELTANQRSILRALASGQFLMRSLAGLASTTRFVPADVEAALVALSNLGLVQSVVTSKGNRWALTDLGRSELTRS